MTYSSTFYCNTVLEILKRDNLRDSIFALASSIPNSGGLAPAPVIYALCRITSTTCCARCGLLLLTCSGAVVRHTGDLCKSIDVKNVQMKKRKKM